MHDEPRLKVKRQGKVLGPMSVVQVADLMAEGKVSESDLVSDGGPWVTFETYVKNRSEPDGVSAVETVDVESLFAEEFAIEFDARGAAKPKANSPATKAGSRKPAPPSLDDDDVVDLLAADEEEDVVDLDLAEDEDAPSKPAARPGAKSSPAKPAASRPTPSASTAKPGAKPSGKPSVRAMPLPPAAKSGAVKPPPPIFNEDDDDLDVMDLLDEKPKPSPAKGVAAKAPSVGKSPATQKPSPGAAGRIAAVPPSPAGMKGSKATNEALSPNLPPGFRPLFNGKNLSGWEFFPPEDRKAGKADCWSVEGGVIRFDGSAKHPHLLSIPDFTDFELFLGWRTTSKACQGGIFLRSDSTPDGMRCWISLGAKDAGKLNGIGTAGSKAAPQFQKPVGEWNVWRIVAAGARVGLWCNQECAWSEGSIKKSKGKIGLRADGSELEFKFLHIRELTKK